MSIYLTIITTALFARKLLEEAEEELVQARILEDDLEKEAQT